MTPNSNSLKLKIIKLSETVGIENEVPKVTRNSPKRRSRNVFILNNVPVKFGAPNEINRHSKLNRNEDSFETQYHSYFKAEQDKRYKDFISIYDDYSHIQSQLTNIPHLFKAETEPEFGQNILMGKKPEHFNIMQIPNNLHEMLYLNLNKNLNNGESREFLGEKQIGALKIEERRRKVEKFLQKRKIRTWNKKISYDCRKRVADSRLRIKGRFVTKKQASELSNLDSSLIMNDFDKISNSDIKNMLATKYNYGTSNISIGRTEGHLSNKIRRENIDSADENNDSNFNDDNNSHFHHANAIKNSKNIQSNILGESIGNSINNTTSNTNNQNLIPSLCSNSNFFGNDNYIRQNNNHESYLLQEGLSNNDIGRDHKDFDNFQDINLDFKLHEKYIKFEVDDYFQNNMSLNL